jgi:hypothetical protein
MNNRKVRNLDAFRNDHAAGMAGAIRDAADRVHPCLTVLHNFATRRCVGALA